LAAAELYTLSWPEVRQEIERGRDTILLSFGAVEQHGPHLPLGTDSIFGDELGRAIADRLDAFRAPTVCVGSSRHHLAFPGTMSVEPETFQRVVEDIVRGWARHGFKRIVLMPTHGGNFEPLAAVAERLVDLDGVKIVAVADISLLVQGTLGLGMELGVPIEEGGLHGGEWETSMMMALRPDLVHMERSERGYTGDLERGRQTFLEDGIHLISETGVFGDPRQASAEHGARYIARLVDLAVEYVESH
jgi:creatinine amidohydrolase